MVRKLTGQTRNKRLPADTVAQIEVLYQAHSRQVLATLIRLLGDFEQAEEALQEAFALALKQWPQEGMPGNPVAWLVSAGRFKSIDQIRRAQTAWRYAPMLMEDEVSDDPADVNEEAIHDDRLRLIFTCCHPGLTIEAQLAMTLREVCGLTTEQVAFGLLQQPSAVAQRIVRAKRKIRDAGIPYEVPAADALAERLQIVLQVIYLMYNEAYLASEDGALVNVNLAVEAIRLGRLLHELLPGADVAGLLALMLLQDSRRVARQDHDGHLVTLEQQDRNLWDHEQIQEGTRWLERALAAGPAGAYTLQAAIAALHAQAPGYADTDWEQIIGLYDVLYERSPTPVVALNRAVAVAMRDGPETGLQLVDELASSGKLDRYHLLHAARADFYRRLGRTEAARDAYRMALALTQRSAERQFIEQRLHAL